LTPDRFKKEAKSPKKKCLDLGPLDYNGRKKRLWGIMEKKGQRGKPGNKRRIKEPGAFLSKKEKT